MGLAGLNYSVSGGIDEADQTLTYTITELPDSSKGVVYLADGITAVTAQQTLSLEELRTLTFLPAENAAGQTTFSFSVTDSGDGDNSITETVNLDILGFNDTPILPTTAIAISDAQEDVAYTFSPADLLAGVTDPDIVYDAEGNITSRDVDNLNVINLSVTNGELTTTLTTINTPSLPTTTSMVSLALTTSSPTATVVLSQTPSASMSLPSTTPLRRPSLRINSPQRATAPSPVN